MPVSHFYFQTREAANCVSLFFWSHFEEIQHKFLFPGLLDIIILNWSHDVYDDLQEGNDPHNHRHVLPVGRATPGFAIPHQRLPPCLRLTVHWGGQHPFWNVFSLLSLWHLGLDQVEKHPHVPGLLLILGFDKRRLFTFLLLLSSANQWSLYDIFSKFILNLRNTLFVYMQNLWSALSHVLTLLINCLYNSFQVKLML